MADVFISYKREERHAAESLARAFGESGYLVWWDRELVGGDRFDDVINEELENARCVLVLWSELATRSTYVPAEAKRGLNRRALICANLDGVELPVPFNGEQQISLKGWDGSPQASAFQDLLRGVARMLGRPYTSLSPRNQALLVGIGNYADAAHFQPMGGAKGVTDAFARVLAKSEGRGFNCDVNVDRDLKTVLRSLSDLAERAASNELALIYFCGHAKVSSDEGVCLCLADSDPEFLEQTTIPLRTLIKKFINRIASEHVIIILDCVFSPADPRATGVDVAETLKQDMSAGKGKHLLTSAATSGAARTDGQSPPLAFSQALIEGLESWDADLSGDNIIALDEWFEYAKSRLGQYAGEPEKWSFGGLPGTVEIARRAPPSQKVVARAEDVPLDFMDRIRTRLAEKRIIPFLGDGIFGTGPLSSFQLVSALARDREVLKSDVSMTLPTAAEYLVRMEDEEDEKVERDRFLAKFRAILEEQAAQCQPKAIHDMVLDMEPPWLVVSTTYDWTLERRLEEAKRPCVVVSHVLRSCDAGDIRGMILPVRLGADTMAEACPAEQLRLDESQECVIYKVLGSPFMNERAVSDAGIDTVVVTETDHTLLLGRLENRATNVPSAFADPFRLRYLFFLGFHLDLWHYRLVGHLFSKGGPAQLRKTPMGVIGKQTPLVEMSFWKLLGADIAQCEVDNFAQALLAKKTGA